MSINQTERFWKWAEGELERRSLTWSTVEREAGLSNATISKRARQMLPPTETTCNGIATVMKIPPERVFRIAGLLPPLVIGHDDQKKETELIDYFRNLKPDSKQAVLTLARALHEQQETYTTLSDQEHGNE